MKKRVKKKSNLLLIITIIIIVIAIILVLLSIFKEKIQLSPSSQTNVRLQVGNAAPTIKSINPIPNVDLIPASTKDVIFQFTARDNNGASNLNDATATASFSKAGEQTRTASSCIKITDPNSKERTYQCTISMQYYDASGTWNVAVNVEDNSALMAQGSSAFIVNLLRDISISPATITFSTLTQGDTNVLSIENTTITNNGNTQVPSNIMEITASNLIGETTPSENIPAVNFKTAGQSEANVCLNGNSLSNSLSTAITSALLPRGPTANTGELSYCLTLVPESISSQFYSTSATGGQPWLITLN